MVPQEELDAFRARSFNPNHPTMRTMAIDSSFHFQVDTAACFAHTLVPDIVDEQMEKLSKLTGRRLHPFDYHGPKDATSVIIMMGSQSQNVQEAVDYANKMGKKYGLITVRLYRPFSTKYLLKAIPKTCKVVTVLDRVREPGACTQPLHSDVSGALQAVGYPVKVLGGIYGIGGREITPSQAATVFENSLKSYPKNLFSLGIDDDLTHTSLPLPKEINMVPAGTKQCIFWGLGSDGTVGANKEAIAIICDKTKMFGQGFFTYDAKKSGGITRSHLRFGEKPITANYPIQSADYIAVHSARFPQLYPVATELAEGATFVLNCSATNAKELEHFLPPHIRRQLYDKHAKVYVIDATKIANAAGIPGRINLIMQAVFFQLSNVLDVDQAIKYLKESVEKNYGHQGQKVVNSNISAIDKALAGVLKIDIPSSWSKPSAVAPSRFEGIETTEMMKKVIFPIFEKKGNEMKPSDFVNCCAAIPTEVMGSSKYEKRGIATKLPIWDPDQCLQCNECSIRCAHAVIRPYLFKGESKLESIDSRALPGYQFRIGVSPYDCLGCGVCAEMCPGKALKMVEATDKLFDELEKKHQIEEKLPDFDFIRTHDPAAAKLESRKFTADGSQYFKPLLEYSGACGGCHETLYAKMLSQLFGPRLMIANATGCSIVWSGSFPSQPWTTNSRGQGPTWGNSLFEDNAEYGFGIYIAFAHRREVLKRRVEDILKNKRDQIPAPLAEAFEEWIANFLNGEKSLAISDKIQDMLKEKKWGEKHPLHRVAMDADLFVKPAVWLVGGDGWANDIGYGGLDHVVASGADVNILVYDNESYANTGFQMSKGTPRGAVTKFAATGKDKPKKKLAQMMLNYPDAYVAQICIGADPRQAVKVMKEAEAHQGVSFIVAYCPCIGQGVKPSLASGHRQAQLAVKSGYWPLYHRDPKNGKLVLDKKSIDIKALTPMLKHEVRFESLRRIDPKRLEKLQGLLASDITQRWKELQRLASQ